MRRVRFIGRLGVIIVFVVLSLLYLDWIEEWEVAFSAKEASWLWQYIIANLFLIAGAFLLELPRILSSRGRIALEWSTLIIFLVPGLFLLLNPFWAGWGLNVSPKLAAHLAELRLLGNMLIGLGIGKSFNFDAFEFYRPRPW